MPIGYFGFARINGNTLLCNTTGLNRQIAPMMSTAVWGAGWYTAAQNTNVAESQMEFAGGITFELQGVAALWNLLRDWLVEQRAFSTSAELSPNFLVRYAYTRDPNDPRSGLWLNSCSFTIDHSALISCACDCRGLKRTETQNNFQFASANLRGSTFTPVSPLNPAPRNRNPFPGWNANAAVTWPGAPPVWTTVTQTGIVLQKASLNVNNNTQVIRGCTGDQTPVAVLQGVMSVEGNMDLWRNGPIGDPYHVPGTFDPGNASVVFTIGGTFVMRMPYLLLTSDAYDVQGQNTPTNRTFGMAGLGDGNQPPFLMDVSA